MAKAVNYTPEQVKMLREAYEAASNDETRRSVVEQFAEEFSKSPRSIVAKLSREGVYVKPASEGKKGGIKKGEIANAIGAFLRLSENEVSSLEKANMTALNKVWNFIREASGEVGKVD